MTMTAKDAIVEIRNRLDRRRVQCLTTADDQSRTRNQRLLAKERAWMLAEAVKVVDEVREKITEASS